MDGLRQEFCAAFEEIPRPCTRFLRVGFTETVEQHEDASRMTRSDPPSRRESRDVRGAQALFRGLDVLFAVALAAEKPRFGELQEKLGIPKASLHRLLSALQSRHLIRYDPQVRQYAIGSRVLDLARGALDGSDLIKATKPELSRLSRRLRVPACLYVRDSDAVFVLDFEDLDASQSSVIRVWPRLALKECAPGHAILAALPHNRRSGEGVHPDIALAKALGYTIRADTNSGTVQVAAAILDMAGHPNGALCCEFPPSSNESSFYHECGRMIAEAARRASSNTSLSVSTPYVAPSQDVPTDKRVEVLETGRDYMGENPLWVSKRGRLYWLDILAPALRWYEPESSRSDRIILPEITGGIALAEGGALVLAGQSGLHRWNEDAQTTTLLLDPEPGKLDNRFNTASVDPQGRLWAGTQALDNTPGQGSLYCIDRDLSFKIACPTVGLPKNAAWSPDGKTLYFSDGYDRCVWAYDLEDGNRLTNKRRFISGNDDIGVPNGITVDAEGGVWASMVGNWSIQRYRSDGLSDQRISLPVPMPMNLTFGGADLHTLYVTSTYLRVPPGFSSRAPHSGKLLSVQTDVCGLPVARFGLAIG